MGPNIERNQIVIFYMLKDAYLHTMNIGMWYLGTRLLQVQYIPEKDTFLNNQVFKHCKYRR